MKKTPMMKLIEWASIKSVMTPHDVISKATELLAEEREAIEIMQKLNDVLFEYNQLLSDECSELVGMAAIHGWKSSRYEKGKALREQIAQLTNTQTYGGGDE